MPKVSVIIPTYNCEKYISEAIDSVLQQTYKDYEIIVIDDGSTDDTYNKLKPYIKNNLIRYMHQHNQGASTSRNNGIKATAGEYICFLDSDDILFPRSIEKRVNLLDRYRTEIGAVFTDYFIQTEALSEQTMPRLKKDKFLTLISGAILTKTNTEVIFNNSLYMRMLGINNPIFTGTIMIRRSIVVHVGYFKHNMVVGEDVDYWLRIAKKYEIGFIDEGLSQYNYYRGKSNNGGVNKAFQSYASPALPYIELLQDPDIIKDKSLCKSLKNKISWLYFDLAHYLRFTGNVRASRKLYLKSVHYNILNLHSWTDLLISVLPNILVKSIKTLKKILFISCQKLA